MIETFLVSLINLVWRSFVGLHEKKNIKAKKHLIQKQALSTEQKKQIDDFFVENYGKKVPYKWHRLYQSYTGTFDYRYIPEYLFTTKMEPLNNQRLHVLPLENKSLLSNFTRGGDDWVRIPQTYVMCVCGRYYDGEGNILDQKAAIELLKRLHGGNYWAICKKTVDTSSGRDVRLLELKAGMDLRKNEDLESVFQTMGKDFIIQERIVAHSSLSGLYSGSINTLRVISYQTVDGYKTAPVILRVGRSGYVDNAHAGGMFIGVTDEGILLKEAFTERGERFVQHPVSNVRFEGYTLPRIPDVLCAAKKMHRCYPTLRFISWDFTIDQNGNIVLIEANLHSQTIWMSQIAHGRSFLGEDAAEMLQLISKGNKKQI